MNFKNALYWGLTLLVAVPMTIAGVTELSHFSDAVGDMIMLGYPIYFLYILGVSKLLGALALVFGNRWATIKEWAYAGFAFDFLAAICSYAATHHYKGTFPPAVLLLLLLGSYWVWKRQRPARRV